MAAYTRDGMFVCRSETCRIASTFHTIRAGNGDYRLALCDECSLLVRLPMFVTCPPSEATVGFNLGSFS